MRVDVWHDTVCPWCRIGLHNLDTVVKSETKVKVEVVHHAFLLQPDAPAEGVDLRAHLRERYGLADVEQMFGRVSQFGEPFGVKFRWDLVTRMPNTAASHALLAWAPAAQKQALLDALHRAYFEEGRDLGDVEVLVALATSVGLEGAGARAAVTSPEGLAAVRASAREASQQGITGVPFFVIAGSALNGAKSPEQLRQAIAQAALAK